jgi:hypothetical protein
MASQQGGLIVAALTPAAGVEGDGDDDVDGGAPARRDAQHQIRQGLGQGESVFVFELVDEGLYRLHEEDGRSHLS